MSVKNVAVGIWKVAVSVRVKNKPYPVKLKKTVHGSKNDALLIEAELRKKALETGQGDGESSLKSGTVAQSTFKINNLKQAIDLYVDKLQATGAFSSTNREQYLWLSKELGHAPILGLRETFKEWLNVYSAPTRSGQPRKAPSTINRVISMVKAVCNHLVNLKILSANPITKALFPIAAVKAREAFLSQEERNRLLDVIRKERPFLEPIVKFMLSVPCRAFSELVTAKRDQLRGNMIFIEKSKNGDALFKPIPADLADYFNSIPSGCDYLFFRQVGDKYLPLNNLRHAFEHCRKLAGLPDLRIHDLRHVAVTNLITRGVPTQVLMKVAGWRSDQTKTYCNLAAKAGAEYVLNLEKEAIKMAS